jgi:hypothetical protein
MYKQTKNRFIQLLTQTMGIKSINILFFLFCFYSCKKNEYIEFKKVVRYPNELVAIDKKLKTNEIKILEKLFIENKTKFYVKDSSIYFKMPQDYESKELYMWVFTDELNAVLKSDSTDNHKNKKL